jgi:hypothetical protein
LTSYLSSPLPIRCIRPRSCCNLRLPLISIHKQLLLVVKKLFPSLGRVLGIWSCKQLASVSPREQIYTGILTLYNRIHRAAFLTQATVNAFRHINIVSSRPPAPVHALLSLYSDGLCRANGFAELACNAALLTSWISSESMLASEARRYRTLLEGIENCVPSISLAYTYPLSAEAGIANWARLTVGGKTAPAAHTCRETSQAAGNTSPLYREHCLLRPIVLDVVTGSLEVVGRRVWRLCERL